MRLEAPSPEGDQAAVPMRYGKESTIISKLEKVSHIVGATDPIRANRVKIHI